MRGYGGTTYLTTVGIPKIATKLSSQNYHVHRMCWWWIFVVAVFRVQGLTTLWHHSTSGKRCSLSSGNSHIFHQQVSVWLSSQNITFRPVNNETREWLSTRGRSTLHSSSTKTVLLELDLARKKLVTSTTRNVALHLIPTPTSISECLPPKLLQTWTNTVSGATKKYDPNHIVHAKDIIHNLTLSADDYIHNHTLSNIQHNPPHYIKIIHLHQDVWETSRAVVQARLLAQLDYGTTRRVYARRTTVRRLYNQDKALAHAFLRDHHLWGATSNAKYAYGLFDKGNDDSLLAVATFGPRRNVQRRGRQHRSHELLRFCTKPNVTVVGGLSKLLRAFCRSDTQPDDIVTLVDRNWGDGTGWQAVGFCSVAVLDPLVMAVPLLDQQDGRPPCRTPLVGHAPLAYNNAPLWRALNATQSADTALQILFDYGYAPVFDAGVERLFYLVPTNHKDGSMESSDDGDDSTASLAVWENSIPSYPLHYYSPNRGVAALLKAAAKNRSYS